MADGHEGLAAQAATDERHAAARDSATTLVQAAAQTVTGTDPAATVLHFGQNHVAPELERMAPCGCVDDVIAAAVFLAAELSLRLAGRVSDA